MTEPVSTKATIDTSGYSQVRHKPWFKDRRYTEVWVSEDNGKSWTMLGMDGPRDDDDWPVQPGDYATGLDDA